MIDKRHALQISGMMDGIESLTLISRTVSGGSDSYSSTPIPRARREAADLETVLSVGDVSESWYNFELFDTGLAFYPLVGYRLQDGNNITYEIRRVTKDQVLGTYYCLALQDK